MKLIDLLVQELPKRGGWPEGAIEAGFLCSDTILYFVDENGDCPSGWRINMGESVEDNDVEISMNQYQSALAASQKVEWIDGLPPVGCECEYTLSGNTWWPCKVDMYVGTQGVVVSCDVFEGIQYVNRNEYTKLQFRPLRSEADKKRDAAIEWIVSIMPTNEMSEIAAGYLYDAIAAGKIPGVKLED